MSVERRKRRTGVAQKIPNVLITLWEKKERKKSEGMQFILPVVSLKVIFTGSLNFGIQANSFLHIWPEIGLRLENPALGNEWLACPLDKLLHDPLPKEVHSIQSRVERLGSWKINSVCLWLEGDPCVLAKPTFSLRIVWLLIYWYNGCYCGCPAGRSLTRLAVTRRWKYCGRQPVIWRKCFYISLFQ